LVAQAEKAVAAVKDPELKRIAFQKVLDDLLRIGSRAPTQDVHAGQRRKVTRARAGARARPAKGGPRAYLDELVDEGFFRKPKTLTNVKAELENRGHHVPMTSLSGPLQSLCQQRTLRRQKVKTSGKKQTFAYSHW
jgi:hypothetical protein